MALINCPSCGSSVSNRASACPHCGRPFVRDTKIPLIIGVVIVIITLANILFAITSGSKDENSPKYNNADSYENQDNHSYVPKTGREGALAKAKEYLSLGGFSKDDLTKQLLYHNFSQSEVNYAISNCGANWSQQALIKAKEYLKVGGFSRESLILQLESHEFSPSEITYAINNCGANWNQQAFMKAKQYLNLDTVWTKSRLIEQLEANGFTYSEAKYGVDNCGGW